MLVVECVDDCCKDVLGIEIEAVMLDTDEAGEVTEELAVEVAGVAEELVVALPCTVDKNSSTRLSPPSLTHRFPEGIYHDSVISYHV